MLFGDKDIYKRCYAFALRIVNAYKFLNSEKNERVMSRQLLRCGTSVGALLCEAKFAQSRADFVNKVSVVLKEANESLYWINLLHDSGYIATAAYDSVCREANEITSILASIVKSTKENTLKYDSQ